MSVQFARCPQCRTTFRVTVQQLALRDGEVRCGQCRIVFNAFAVLVDFKGSRMPGPGMEGAQRETMTLRDLVLAKEDDFTVAARHINVALPSAAATPEPKIAISYLSEASAPNSSAATLKKKEDTKNAGEKDPRRKKRRGRKEKREPSPMALVLDMEKPTLWQRLRLPGWCRPLFYAVTLPVVTIVLATQATYFFHDELAHDYPKLTPALQHGCRWLGCDIRPLQDLEVLTIEASDLQSHPDDPQQLVLMATVRNRSAKPIAYPALRLDLTDTQGKLQARRYFTPPEYLTDRASVDQGLSATSDHALRLLLRSNLAAAGYRLSLVYL